MAKPKQSAQRRVRYAVIGLGHITQVALLPAFAHAKRNSQLSALVSGDAAKLRTLGRKYGVTELHGYSGYESLLESGGIDAVYIGLPNDLHYDYVKPALRAGVHVLCEKPLAPTEAECAELVQLAADERSKLMTAYRLHFERINVEVLQLVRSGRIGPARIFSSDFTMQVRDQDNIRLSADRAGGPLNDIGIYCLNAARNVFGVEPLRVCAFAARSSEARFREVEEAISAVLSFPGERLATFTCSFGAGDVSSYRIIGTKGDVRVEPAFEYASGLGYTITVNGKQRSKQNAARDQFGPELLAFSDWVLGGKAPSTAASEGWADVRVLEAIRRSARQGGKPQELESASAPKRPELKQVRDLAAVGKPRLVRARSASS